MSNVETDNSREDRIDMEIVVDAYNSEERAISWYYYLDAHLNFPFKAIWISGTSEEVEVVGMSPEEYCSQQMFVEALYKEGSVADTFLYLYLT